MTIKNFDTGIVPPTTVTEERPYIIGAGVMIYQVQEGKICRISDWVPYAYHYPELTKGG